MWEKEPKPDSKVTEIVFLERVDLTKPIVPFGAIHLRRISRNCWYQ